MKIMRKLCRIDYRHYICIGLTLGALAWLFFVRWFVIERIVASCVDFGLSFAFCICFIFRIPNHLEMTVTRLPNFNDVVQNVLPQSFDTFKLKITAYWHSLWNAENFGRYWWSVGTTVGNGARYLLIIGMLLFLIVFLFLRLQLSENTERGDTRSLRVWRQISARTYLPVKRWLRALIEFIRSSYYPRVWFGVLLVGSNVLPILLGALAYAFYFVVSFDFVNLYVQFIKLFSDLALGVSAFPWYVWVGIAIVLFLRWRKNIADNILMHAEMQNRGFLKSQPITIMDTGTMGTGKTTLLADSALSQSIMFRNDALEIMTECDYEFPCFPWQRFEDVLRRAIDRREVRDWPTCKRWVSKLRTRFENRMIAEHFGSAREWANRPAIMGYDYKRYGLYHNDALKMTYLFDTLADYARMYFLYIIETSLLVANFSMREDNVLMNHGNFPLWNTDFLNRDPRNQDAISQCAHILDFDIFRLGRKVVEDNPNSGSLGFGMYCVTEIAKERGNIVTNEGKKRNDDETNQKNDLFNLTVKMLRHAATVRGRCFIRFYSDDQRESSIDGDFRELNNIVHIRAKDDTQLALPFFWVEDLIGRAILAAHNRFYMKYRFKRGDRTLFLHAYHLLVSKIQSFITRTYNRYGYHVLNVETERGTKDGALEEHKYFLIHKKIYARRFATDALSGRFDAMAARAKVGLIDYPVYGGDVATTDELDAQNSYFNIDISKYAD